MNTITRNFVDILCYAVFIILALSIVFLPLPVNDNQVFWYVARSIGAGQLHYADVWDHKGPIIHLYYLLGCLIAPNSALGVKIVHFLAFLTTQVMIYLSLNKVCKTKTVSFLATLCCSISIISNVGWIQWDMTENVYVTFSSIALYIGIDQFKQHLSSCTSNILLGCLAALAVLTKANYGGIAVFVALLYSADAQASRAYRRFFIRAGWCICGFVGCILLFLCIYASIGACSDMLDASFFYNLREYKVNDHPGISNLFYFAACEHMALSGWLENNTGAWILLTVALAGYLTQLIRKFIAGQFDSLRKTSSSILIIVSAIGWLLFELFSIGLKGETYPHYYNTAVLPLFLCCVCCLGRSNAYFAIAVLSINLIQFLVFGIQRLEKSTYCNLEGMESCLNEKSKGKVAVFGGILACEVMNRFDCYTKQKYCINRYVLSHSSSPARRIEVERDFIQALQVAPILISEVAFSEIPIDSRKLQKYEDDFQLMCRGVNERKKWMYVYVRKNNGND